MTREPYVLAKAGHEHVQEIDGPSRGYLIQMGGTVDGSNSAYYAETYGGFMREGVGFEPNVYVVIENAGDVDVVNPRVVVNGRRDWRSVDAILAEVTRPGMSDEEIALSLYRHCASYQTQAHENDLRVDQPFVDATTHPSRNTFKERGDPVKGANCYYCSGCSLSASNLVILCRRAGLEARAIWISPLDRYASHCVAEVRWDDKYHLLDPEYGAFYLTADNGEIASYREVHEDVGLVHRTHHCGFANGEQPGHSVPYRYDLYYPPAEMPVEAWHHRMDITLRPGEQLVRRWDNVPKFRHGDNPRHKEGVPHRLANGKLIYRPDLSSRDYRRGIAGELNVSATWEDGLAPNLHPCASGAPGHVIYRVSSPYPIVGGLVGGRFRRASAGDSLSIWLSIRDSDWIQIWSAEGTGEQEAYVEIDAWVGPLNTDAAYDYYVKYAFLAADDIAGVGLDQVYLESDLEMAGTSLPALSLAANQVIYQDDTPGPHAMRVVHGWEESSESQAPRPPAGAVFPEDGAIVALGDLTMLRWQRATDPAADLGAMADYHVQVSARPDMLIPVSPNLDRITFSGDPSWAVPGGWLMPGRRYYWRVRARNAQGLWSGWSRVWSMETS